MIDSFAERDLQLKAPYASSPPCIQTRTCTWTYTRVDMHTKTQRTCTHKPPTFIQTQTHTHTHTKKHTHTHANHTHTYTHIHKLKSICSKSKVPCASTDGNTSANHILTHTHTHTHKETHMHTHMQTTRTHAHTSTHTPRSIC